jgi:inner membrane transporter RhtA
MLDRFPGPLLLLLAIISLQVGSALAISLFGILTPLGTLFLRMAIAGLGLCLLYRAGIAHALRQAPLGVSLLGVTMVLQSGSFYEALARIPLGIAVSIEFLGPLGVALVASRRWQDIGCVVLAGAGVFLLTPSIGVDLDPFGVIFAFGAAAGWAAFIVVSKKLGKVLEGGVGLALAMAMAGIILFPLFGVSAISTIASSPSIVITVLGVALFSAAIPLLFEFLALKTMSPKSQGAITH